MCGDDRGSMAGLPAGDSIILEEEVDPAYEPTQDEVLEYARWLGMDCDVDSDLLYVVCGVVLPRYV